MSNADSEITINFDSLLKMGYAVVDVRFREYEISNTNMKYIITRIEGDRDDFYPEMLKYYLGKDAKDKNAYELWTNILRHKLRMSESLQRDVSIKVAAIDYLENHMLT